MIIYILIPLVLLDTHVPFLWLENKLDQEKRRLEMEIQKTEEVVSSSSHLLTKALSKKSRLQRVLSGLKVKEEKMLSNELSSIEEVEAFERQALPPAPQLASPSTAGMDDVASFDWSLLSPMALAELDFGAGTPQPS